MTIVAVSAKLSRRFCTGDFEAAMAFMAGCSSVLGEDGHERQDEKLGGVMP
jgi:pterin-4a-carbinolamine dehydratase